PEIRHTPPKGLAAPTILPFGGMAHTSAPRSDSWPIFRRLLRMMRPEWPMIGLGLLLLLLSAPCELFPAIAWSYITDDIVLQKNLSPWMTTWFSFGGRFADRFALLLSAVSWMFAVYLLGELFGTLETWVLNRVAQRFILSFRN